MRRPVISASRAFTRVVIGLHHSRGLQTGKGVVSGLKLLEHRHIVGDGLGGFVSYDHAHALQEDVRAKFLSWKGLCAEAAAAAATPRPHLLSFEATPTFTLGRRQDALDASQEERLRRDLYVRLPHRVHPVAQTFRPDVRQTSRGGLTTYHGPGQIVFWPVLDMHSPLYERYSVMSYASHLEATTQRLLSTLFDIQTYTSRDEPGVWVKAGGPPRKIAALGVHHRRHVTALGIAVNVDVPVSGDEDVNAWARFVPCGLDGKLVTSIAAEAAGGLPKEWDIPTLAGRWASIFEEGLRDASRRGLDGELRRVMKE